MRNYSYIAKKFDFQGGVPVSISNVERTLSQMRNQKIGIEVKKEPEPEILSETPERRNQLPSEDYLRKITALTVLKSYSL